MTSAKPVVRDAPLIVVSRRKPTPTPVFDTFWRFACERQQIYHARLRGEPAPWTDDPVLSAHRFTNCYRISDRVSQYLVREVQRGGPGEPEDLVLRTLLFKLFNRIETWQLLEDQCGTISAEIFNVAALDRILSQARAAGHSIYSGAYIMPSGPAELRTSSKHRMHLEFLGRGLKDGTLRRLAENPQGLKQLYLQLLAEPGIGSFLAYQYAIDLNYTEHYRFSENDFVMPGPGARDGLRKCFADLGDYTESDAIHWMRERQDDEFAARGLSFQTLWGRPLASIDVQNLLCEVDKYARAVHPEFKGASGRERIKQRFHANDAPFSPPTFPAWWNITVPEAWEGRGARAGGQASLCM